MYLDVVLDNNRLLRRFIKLLISYTEYRLNFRRYVCVGEKRDNVVDVAL